MRQKEPNYLDTPFGQIESFLAQREWATRNNQIKSSVRDRESYGRLEFP